MPLHRYWKSFIISKDLYPEADNKGTESSHCLIASLNSPGNLLLGGGGGRECEERGGEGSRVEGHREGSFLT